jgi:PTH1 family peptidyl-tRNA hydrolase
VPQEAPLWLIVGLGNPGEEYARHRHNVGFMVADRLADRLGLSSLTKKHGGLLGLAALGDARVCVLKPMEYMNRSGGAVAKTAAFYSVGPERIVVIHDDVDLDFGQLRAKAGGGNLGHNGLRSISALLKTQEYLRLRVGIGRSAPKGVDVTNHVLSDFSKSERQALDDEILPKAADALECIIRRGVDAAIEEFNRPPKPKKAEKPVKDPAA